jgi:urea transport system permease protein
MQCAKGVIMNDLVVTVLNALTLTSILMLVAMGLAIIYGLMGVINLAHGEFVTIGAYCLVATQSLGGNFWLALVFAPLVGYILGSLIEIAMIRRLYKHPIATILATWGLGLVLQQSIQYVFGAAPQAVTSPFDGTVALLSVTYPAYRLFLIAMAAIIVTGCACIFRFTNFGLDIQAVIQNREMAESLGIDTTRVYRIAFGAGAALAAIAGVLLAPLTVVIAQMGVSYLARSFFVVIVGGAGSVVGVAAGSGIVGGLETLLSHEIPSTVAQALVLAFAAILMRFKPNGILGGAKVK